MKNTHDYLLKRKEVEELVKLSRSEIYKKMNAGKFPRPVRIAPKAVRWRDSDIQQWIKEISVGL